MKTVTLIRRLLAIEARFPGSSVAVCTDEIQNGGRPGYNRFKISPPAGDRFVVLYPGRNVNLLKGV